MSLKRPFTPFPREGEPPYVIAHRGISGKNPENTPAAFRHALSVDGIDMIELDVRLAGDDEVIVLHDRTLQRTTTGNGPARRYSVSELKTYDAGSWFDAAFRDERIPTLREVLEMVDRRCWVNIELKEDPVNRPPAGLLERRVLEAVCEGGYSGHVLCSSFSQRVRATLRALGPSVPIGVIYNLHRDFFSSPSRLASRSGASVLVCSKAELRPSMMEDARRHGLAVYVYTLNSARDVQRMVENGVCGVLSDNADEVVSMIKGRKCGQH